MRARTNKEKLELIEDAVGDWNQGKLTADAAMIAIHIITRPKRKMSEKAMDWARLQYHKWGKENGNE